MLNMQSLFDIQETQTRFANPHLKNPHLTNLQCELSEEQLQYVQNNHDGDTKLIACAGSGKTKCMIERVRYLINRQIYTKEQIMIFSYSKPVIEHMKQQCKLYKDYKQFMSDSLIRTIDSFCFDLLNKDEQQSIVQVLSAKASQLLTDMNVNPDDHKKLLKKFNKSKYGKIKAIFIDEAQDLNEIQYNIILRLKQIIGCTLHLVGDPNQNIYQFRNSFEKYLLQHPAQQFQLTFNFRCSTSINDFSQYFRFYNNQEQISQLLPLNKQSQSKVIISANQKNANDEFIIHEIQKLLQNKVPAQEIAIISPTIGDQFNTGIIRIANLLHRFKIPTVNFYSESKDQVYSKRNQSKRGGVNLLTIHASKGLEYHSIFLIKFVDKMLKSEQYDAQFIVSQNMNLLYVATTRARENLFICHDTQPSHSKHICSILYTIPTELYNCLGSCEAELKIIDKKITQRKQIAGIESGFVSNHRVNEYQDVLLATKILAQQYFELNKHELSQRSSQFQWKTSVTQFIQQLSQTQLLQILDSLQYKKKHKVLYDMSEQDVQKFNELRVNYEQYIGCLFEYMLYYQIQQIKGKYPKIHKFSFTITEQIQEHLKVNSLFIVNNKTTIKMLYNTLLDLSTRKDLTIQELNSTLEQIRNQYIINDYKYQEIDRDIKNNTAEIIDLGNIGMQQLKVLLDNSDRIFGLIDDFNIQKDWREKLDSLIYFTMIKFAVSSKHQKYLVYDEKLISQFKQFLPVFEKMMTLSQELSSLNIQYQYEVGEDIIGFIDFLVTSENTNHSTIIDLKVQNDLGAENIIQILMYDILYNEKIQLDNNNQLIIINCLKGVQYEIAIENKLQLHQLFLQLIKEDYIKRTI